MAQPIPCDICNETLADFMLTVIANGDVKGICVPCCLQMTIGVLEQSDTGQGILVELRDYLSPKPAKRARAAKAPEPPTEPDGEPSDAEEPEREQSPIEAQAEPAEPAHA